MLGIIIVNYKTVDQTVHYIQNEICKITVPNRIVVVNVASNDDTNKSLTNKIEAFFVADIDAAIDTKSHIFIIAEPENVGYAKGNNIGAAFFKKHFEMDHYLISNNDIKFIDSDVVARLIKKLESLPDVGAIGPKIVGNDGQDQSPAKKMGIWHVLVVPVMLYPLLYFFLKIGCFTDVLRQANEGVYYRISGAFFIVKRKVFDAVNGFDLNTFLYAEEMIFSERMLAVGFLVYFLPSVSILHEQGLVVNQHLSFVETNRLSLNSKLYYYRKYCQTNFFSIFAARLAWKIFYIFYLPVILSGRNIANKISCFVQRYVK